MGFVDQIRQLGLRLRRTWHAWKAPLTERRRRQANSLLIDLDDVDDAEDQDDEDLDQILMRRKAFLTADEEVHKREVLNQVLRDTADQTEALNEAMRSGNGHGE